MVRTVSEADAEKLMLTKSRISLSLWDTLKCLWQIFSAKIESIPPFWTAFALTLTETVGAGTLGLPIAFATVGPIAGVVLLVVLGLVNYLTVSYLAEASARNRSIRYGKGFVGSLIQDYLGPSASIVFRICLFSFCCIVLASYYTGFASTLSAVTDLSAPYWVCVVCTFSLILILRKTLRETLASALLIGLINISILLVLSAIALQHATVENLLHMDVPFLGGKAFESSHVQLVFGVVMVSYFGHLSVSNCAQTVLRRDPSGRSLKRGTTAAMLVAIVIYSVWSASVAGAVGSANLTGETGTALVPLAEKIGPEIYFYGVVFSVLGLGMSSVHFGLGLFNMSKELLANTNAEKKKSWDHTHAAKILAMLPILAVFAYVQWTYYNKTPSFIAPLELIGVLLTPVLAGIFPVLLLLASRAQGLDGKDARVSVLGSNPLVLAVIVLLSFAGLLLHGLYIWEDTLSRASALLTSMLMIVLIANLIYRKVFTPILHIDVGHYPEENHKVLATASFNGNALDLVTKTHHLNASKHPTSMNGHGNNFTNCKKIIFELPDFDVSKVQLDAYTISAEFQAKPMPCQIKFHTTTPRKRQVVSFDSQQGSTSLKVPVGCYSRIFLMVNQ